MKNYAQRFKKATELRLISIIENSHAYAPEAVEAAQKELESRNLDRGDMAEIRERVRKKAEAEEQQQQRIETLKGEAAEKMAEVGEAIRPFGEKEPLMVLKTLAALLALNGAVGLAGRFNYLKAVFTHPLSDGAGLYEFEILMTAFLAMGGGYFLWRQKHIGWIFSVAVLSFTFIQMITGAYIEYLAQQPPAPDLIPLQTNGMPYYLFMLVAIAGMIWYLNRADIRELFGISFNTQINTIGIPALIGIAQSLDIFIGGPMF